MSRKGGRRRGASPEDVELWARVAATVAPMHPKRRAPSPPEAEAPLAPPVAAVPRPSLPAFRLGEEAMPRPAPLPLPTTPAQRLQGAELRMDSKTHKRMTRGKLRPEARLDLHGMTLSQAQPELVDFVISCHMAGFRLVLVITGKGRGEHGPLPTRPGALRHQVPFWLHAPPLGPLVQQVAAAHDRHGGEGAYYVYLRRRV